MHKVAAEIIASVDQGAVKLYYGRFVRKTPKKQTITATGSDLFNELGLSVL